MSAVILTDYHPDGRSVVTDVFFETGLCTGQTLAEAVRVPGFRELHSVDVCARHVEAGRAAFAHDPRVRIHLGSSPRAIADHADPARPTTFWLDAHYQGNPAAGEIDPDAGECPLLAELAVIRGLPWRTPPIVIVDDAHIFDRPWVFEGAHLFDPAQWPTLDQVEAALPGYDLVRKGHVLYFFPPAAD